MYSNPHMSIPLVVGSPVAGGTEYVVYTFLHHYTSVHRKHPEVYVRFHQSTVVILSTPGSTVCYFSIWYMDPHGSQNQGNPWWPAGCQETDGGQVGEYRTLPNPQGGVRVEPDSDFLAAMEIHGGLGGYKIFFGRLILWTVNLCGTQGDPCGVMKPLRNPWVLPVDRCGKI